MNTFAIRESFKGDALLIVNGSFVGIGHSVERLTRATVAWMGPFAGAEIVTDLPTLTPERDTLVSYDASSDVFQVRRPLYIVQDYTVYRNGHGQTWPEPCVTGNLPQF